VGSVDTATTSQRDIATAPAQSSADAAWALTTAALSLGAGTAIAAIAIPGVRATTGASGATAVLEGVARGVMVAVPLAVGLYARRRPAHARFGGVLVAVSCIWFLALLSSSAAPVIYSTGRVASWFAEVAIGYAVLAFPTGRLEASGDRRLIASATCMAATLYLLSAPLVARYPTPFPWGSCDANCPANAFMVVHHQPAFIDGFVVPLRSALTVLVFVSVAARLAARLRASSTLMRRAVAPVLAASSVRMLLFALAVGIREAAPHSSLTTATMWTLAALVPAIALAFLFGLVLWRMYVTTAIQGVHARLHGIPGPEQVRDALSEAFEDPGLLIGSWIADEQRWATVDGAALRAPAAGSGRHLTEVTDRGAHTTAILHDAALRDERAFLDVASSLSAMAFASDQLTSRTAAILLELRASRARIAAAADSERRRIERDLHDGAQQRLVGLSIQLELAADQAERADPREAASLRQLRDEVDRSLEEIRSLARGIYPAVLSDRGLAAAVRSAALRATVPTTVHVSGLTDYPQEISTAVYLCCVEALQNVAKHAHGATGAQIVLEESNSVLRFSVTDDGAGFLASRARVGAGIINMQDRMATVGGELTVRSRPGEGTVVRGRVPLSVTAHSPADQRHGPPSRSGRPLPRRASHES